MRSAHSFVAGGPHTLIYGPPAVGKLTVARELAALTGFGLFHNHATVDLVTSVFDRGSESFARLVWEIRLSVFEEAARVNIGRLVFTMDLRHLQGGEDHAVRERR